MPGLICIIVSELTCQTVLSNKTQTQCNSVGRICCLSGGRGWSQHCSHFYQNTIFNFPMYDIPPHSILSRVVIH